AGWRHHYTSIRVDEPLDDSLFSLEPPADYKIARKGLFKPWSEHSGQLFAKIDFLNGKCWEYANEHNNRFPSALTDLRSVGVTDDILKIVMAPEGQPDAPPIIVFRQPRLDHDWAREIVFYESFDQWPVGGIAVGMVDGNSRRVAEKAQFNELMK